MDTDIEPTTLGRWQVVDDMAYRHEISDGHSRHRIVCSDGRHGDWVQFGSIAQLDDARAASTAFLDTLPANTVFTCRQAPERPEAASRPSGEHHRRRQARQ